MGVVQVYKISVTVFMENEAAEFKIHIPMKLILHQFW